MMTKEIERRWIIPSDLFGETNIIKTKIKRLGDSSFIRVRYSVNHEVYKMTYKYGHGINRIEREVEITEGEYNDFNEPEHVFTATDYSGFSVKWIKELKVCIAEREFDSVEQAKDFDVPDDWKEVTDDKNYEYLTIYEKFAHR